MHKTTVHPLPDIPHPLFLHGHSIPQLLQEMWLSGFLVRGDTDWF